MTKIKWKKENRKLKKQKNKLENGEKRNKDK